MNVVSLDRHRRWPCPHCDIVLKIPDLVIHIDHDCPVLKKKRCRE